MLLVSVVTPHHHHGDTVCLGTECYMHETKEAGHDCDEDFAGCCHHQHDDEHDEDASDDDCIAKARYLVSAQSEIKSKFRPCDGHHHNIHFVYVFLYTLNFYDAEAKLVYLTKHRYKEKYFFREPANVNRINGLRAPPFAIA
jgi:hypothetical protein